MPRRMLLASMMSGVMIAAFLVVAQPATGDEVATFDSLSDDDPVIPGGVTPAMVQQWLNEGWTVEQRVTPRDLPDTLVQFRRPVTNELEWRRGTVPAGTVYYVRSHIPGGPTLEQILRPCGNVMIPPPRP
jgi:hypothetical protein